jgi:4-amino-4-deoxy-L-arabinose transferase-like glycosyltransferase
MPWSLAVLFIPWQSQRPHPGRRFCLIAIATVVTFFSVASAKLVPYILPAFPFAALATADGLMVFADGDNALVGAPLGMHSNARNADPRRLAWMTLLLVTGGFAVLAVAVEAEHFQSPYPAELQAILYVAGASAVISTLVCTAAFWTRRFEAGLVMLLGATALTVIVISYGRLKLEPTRSYAALARRLERLAPDARLICYPRYIESLPFYCRRRVILVGAKTELGFGAEHCADASNFFFSGSNDLVRLWNEPQPSVFVIDRGVLGQIRGLLGGYTVIASDSRKLALVPRQKGARKGER